MGLRLGHSRIYQKYLKNVETWCSRSMERISCTDCVRHEHVLRRVKVERKILDVIKRRKADQIGHILYCVTLKKREVGWKLKEETAGRTLWQGL
jgi:ppGpp synthetase/RelA/SpoT-type nucleotidyltranferase